MILNIFLFILYAYCINAQLVVNVLNKGGEIIKETIIGNTTLDTIHLDFEKYDGTKVQQFIDFRNVCIYLYAIYLIIKIIVFDE